MEELCPWIFNPTIKGGVGNLNIARELTSSINLLTIKETFSRQPGTKCLVSDVH